MVFSFPWASSAGTDVNYDFHTTHTTEQQRSGTGELNFRPVGPQPEPQAGEDNPRVSRLAGVSGVDWPTYAREISGMSAFLLEDGVVYHTYSAYLRGLNVLWGMYQWLDGAPRGRNEDGSWWRRHDEYDSR